eukprot:scaffold111488_cov19-Tisochrysis_lutea.AAC.2
MQLGALDQQKADKTCCHVCPSISSKKRWIPCLRVSLVAPCTVAARCRSCKTWPENAQYLLAAFSSIPFKKISSEQSLYYLQTGVGHNLACHPTLTLPIH